MNRRWAIVTSIGALLLACGGTNPGGGSGTLYVTARFSTDGSTPSTRARVVVREAAMSGAIIGNAQVSVSGAKLPKAAIAFVEASNEYRLDAFGWDEALKLEVVRGDDRLDATVVAPGLSIITAPTQDATISRADGLRVTWRDSLNQPADIARVRLERAQLDRTLAKDRFSFDIPTDQLVVNDRETLLLERSNDVAPAGGAPGSVMSLTTTHSIQFKVE